MGKDLNGKELGNGIMQRKDTRYVGRFINRFGRRKEVYGTTKKEVVAKLSDAMLEDRQHSDCGDNDITDRKSDV